MKTDRERDGWEGPVQSVVGERASYFKLADEWAIGPREIDFTWNYSREGEKTSALYGLSTMVSGTSSDDRIKKYDAEGRIIEQEKYRDGILQYRMFLTYDTGGREIERVVCSPDGALISKTVHKYDGRGKPVEMLIYKSDSSLESKHVYTNKYDSFGNLIEMKVESWTSVPGELNYKPLFVIYHTLTYF